MSSTNVSLRHFDRRNITIGNILEEYVELLARIGLEFDPEWQSAPAPLPGRDGSLSQTRWLTPPAKFWGPSGTSVIDGARCDRNWPNRDSLVLQKRAMDPEGMLANLRFAWRGCLRVGVRVG